MIFDQPLASANAPWTRTMDVFDGAAARATAARANAARGSMASRSNFIFPPSVLSGNRNPYPLSLNRARHFADFRLNVSNLTDASRGAPPYECTAKIKNAH